MGCQAHAHRLEFRSWIRKPAGKFCQKANQVLEMARESAVWMRPDPEISEGKGMLDIGVKLG